jgi:hypothetical protein
MQIDNQIASRRRRSGRANSNHIPDGTLLHTIENFYGLNPLGNSATAPIMSSARASIAGGRNHQPEQRRAGARRHGRAVAHLYRAGDRQ